ncbi:DUF951 domain-containing protein [Mitsuokella sp. AF21-1AC]|uniref:DUF951 domain-containing protein n=1 Tax=Mitsuokella sp. AF21-1AC TaxID=2292235 RepID=UPI000E50F6EE|nr:DUF951 domain-containing protein [Mitsuokella sp. AF21-1AC]RGS71072.1 DUF951 domain-containing protein [Mitsuokella sp. AF21-1AC]
MANPTYAVGDIVRMKKAHPCGSHEWEILRTGMDFRLKCQGCGHLVMMPRTKFERLVREIVHHVEAVE